MPIEHVSSRNVGIRPPGFRLPESAHVGKVRLAVSDLQQSVEFYSGIIGLAVLERSGSFARLGVPSNQRMLLELEEVPGVNPIGKRTRLGLYHTAFLLPTRADLGSFVRHITEKKIHFGAGDHIYSEAIYLTDPDGLSVEVYADRSQSEWIYEGAEVVSATNSVDFAALLEVAGNRWNGAPTGTTVGHVHLYVGDLKEAAKFYSAGLGLDIMTWRYPGALFTSAGGYHHHVGLNVWAAGSPVASATDARLLFWEMVLPDAASRDRALESLELAGYMSSVLENGVTAVSDPWGITVALVVNSSDEASRT